uniref:Dirigent protein n=1 Tax=Kadsura heteroclita TaxID=124781 RepID=A0A7U3VI86_9MAGN|nr:dirigent protein 10 [Kadsura heteroclita]
MATFFSSSSSLFAFVFFLAHHAPTAASTHYHNHHKLKTLNFSLFQQETTNKTGFVIVKGVEAGTAPNFALPFGSMVVSMDPLTLKPDPSSEVAGVLEGTFIASTLDGLRNLAILTLRIKQVMGHEGWVYILGSVHNTKVSVVPVVGGTGDFLFVQGYVTYSPVSLKPPSFTYKFEFNLFWPPYATPGSY